MAEVVLFHHVQGLTDGILAFADQLRSGGHRVHTPDLFDGVRPSSIEDGVAHAQGLGETFDARVRDAVAGLPADVVYAGFSMGGGAAQELTQKRPGARGALLYETCISTTGPWSFGPWPSGVPVQIHGMDRDPYFAFEGDLEAARELVQTLGPELAELYVYPGERHLFADSSLPSYDPEAAALLVERSLAFLDRVG